MWVEVLWVYEFYGFYEFDEFYELYYVDMYKVYIGNYIRNYCMCT